MPRVRMLVQLVGDGWMVVPGELFTCDDATAERLIAAGHAERVPGVVESTMKRMRGQKAVLEEPVAR